MYQSFIDQEIYEDSFIFHVIYFKFTLFFLCKNKIKIKHDQF